MADASYQPKVYRKRGGDELVVASGGTITVESGGAIVSGPVAAGTTSANLPAGGLSYVVSGSSATGTNNFTIANPVIGQHKFITATSVTNSSDCVGIVGVTTGVTFGPTAMPRLKIVAAGTVELIGRTTAIYDFIPLSTAIVFATTVA